MTDNDIIKALESIKYRTDGIITRGYYFDPETFEQVVDLVNRQKAEIERLEKQNKELLISETCELHIPMEIACRVRTGHPIFKAIKSEVVREIFEILEGECLAYPIQDDHPTILVDAREYFELKKEIYGGTL